MDELANLFDDLDESAPEFRKEWADRLARALEAVRSVQVEETVEGGEVLYRGALALEYTFQALSVLPETKDRLDPIFRLQLAIANARRGAVGPLQFSDPEARRARGRAGNPRTAQRLNTAMCAAFAVELLLRATTPMKTTTAYKTVADMFGKVGIRGARGGRLSHQTVASWHASFSDPDTIEHTAIETQLGRVLPLTQVEAIAEAKQWAKAATERI